MIELPEPDGGELTFLTKQQMKMIMDAGIAHGREQMREELLAKVRPQSIAAEGLKLLLKELP